MGFREVTLGVIHIVRTHKIEDFLPPPPLLVRILYRKMVLFTKSVRFGETLGAYVLCE